MYQRRSVQQRHDCCEGSAGLRSKARDAVRQVFEMSAGCTRTHLTSSLSVPSSSAYIQLHIRSISSQSVTIPCSIGYLIFRRPRNSWARRPMKTSPSRAPAMTRTCFGRPTLRHSVNRVECHAKRGGYIQGWEEAFWMILTSEACLDSA